MTIESRVSILTTSMRTEFQTAFDAVAKPAPWEEYTQIIPSTARIEHYTWMSPSPGMALFAGHRRYGKAETVRYSVENHEFDASFEILMRDVRDDQTSGYVQIPKQLGRRAALFPGRWVIKHLAAGATRTCFDGSAFFADSHTIGTGDNLLTHTCAGTSDGATYKIAAMFTGGPLKPLLWQNRMGPDMQTNAGTPASAEAKKLKYWIDMEGEAAYGYWWDGVQITLTNTPTITDLYEVMRKINNAFRSFKLPTSLTSEDGEYVHEQERFTSQNMVLVGPPDLETQFDHLFNETWAPMLTGTAGVASTNLFKGKGTFIPSNFMV